MVSIDDRLNQIIRELIGNGITLEQAVEAFEGKYIVAAMSASRGNVTQASKALGVHDIHERLGLADVTQEQVARALDELEQDGVILPVRGKRYSLLEFTPYIAGAVRVHPDGYGTIFGGGGDEPDIYIDRRAMKGAMNGDLVIA